MLRRVFSSRGGTESDEGVKIPSMFLDMMKYALCGAGPFLLKVLQQLSNVVKTQPWLEALTKDVFNAVPPLSSEEFKFVRSTLRLPQVYLDNLVPSTLGSASLAQVHLTRDEFDAKVILKILRPMYAYYFLCECDYLLTDLWILIGTVARAPGFLKEDKSIPSGSARLLDMARRRDLIIKQTRQLLLFLVREYSSEFDYEQESLYTVLGYSLYHQPSLHIFSAQVLRFTTQPFPAIVQTMGSDQTLHDLVNYWKGPVFQLEHPGNTGELLQLTVPLIYATLQNLVVHWFRTVFWSEPAFFHGDLHMGNLMTVSFAKLEALARAGATHAPIHVIDYGSCGVLTRKTKCRLLTALVDSGRLYSFHTLIPAAGDELDSPSPVRQHSQEALDILGFYKKRALLTPAQRAGLLDKLESPVIQRQHVENIRLVKKFIDRIWGLCEVKDRTDSHRDELWPKLLNYSKMFGFGYLFLRIAEHGRSIGMCTSNPIIMFGRGISYLTESMYVVEMLMGQPRVPVSWMENFLLRFAELLPAKVGASLRKKFARNNASSVDRLIKEQILRNPAQLLNYVREKPIC